MSIKPFFRLAIISFICTFIGFFILFINKVNEINKAALQASYNYSPDFIKIIGYGFFVFCIVSLSLHHYKIYRTSLKNTGIIVLSILLTLTVNYYSSIFITDIFIDQFSLDTNNGYRSVMFWLPVFSRTIELIIIAGVSYTIIFFFKRVFKLTDEVCPVDIDNQAIKRQLQLTLFIFFYLAINFIFQRYLYIPFYLYQGVNVLSEYHNLAFYTASVVTGGLLILFVIQANPVNKNMQLSAMLIPTLLILLSQLIIAIMVCLLLIYSIVFYYQWNLALDSTSNIYYMNPTYTMLNSIFIVPILTSIATYYAGRFWIRKFYLYS